MENNDCFCQNVSPFPYQTEQRLCTGENCMFYKYAMKNPKVKELMDLLKEKIQKEENILVKLAWAIGGDALMKSILEGRDEEKNTMNEYFKSDEEMIE